MPPLSVASAAISVSCMCRFSAHRAIHVEHPPAPFDAGRRIARAFERRLDGEHDLDRRTLLDVLDALADEVKLQRQAGDKLARGFSGALAALVEALLEGDRRLAGGAARDP